MQGKIPLRRRQPWFPSLPAPWFASLVARMGLLLTLIAGLALWVLLWGIDLMKSFDAFMLTMLLVLLAATARIVLPYLPGGRR
jgi:hypothetical protein